MRASGRRRRRRRLKRFESILWPRNTDPPADASNATLGLTFDAMFEFLSISRLSRIHVDSNILTSFAREPENYRGSVAGGSSLLSENKFQFAIPPAEDLTERMIKRMTAL